MFAYQGHTCLKSRVAKPRAYSCHAAKAAGLLTAIQGGVVVTRQSTHLRCCHLLATSIERCMRCLQRI